MKVITGLPLPVVVSLAPVSVPGVMSIGPTTGAAVSIVSSLLVASFVVLPATSVTVAVTGYVFPARALPTGIVRLQVLAMLL